MTAALLIFIGLALLVVYGLVQAACRRVRKHGAVVLLWRYFSGAAWHGKPVTDAGWVRPGTRALTRTGHASRFHHRPRWQRSCWRTGPVLGVLASLYGLVVAESTTVRCLFGFTLLAFAYIVVRAVLAVRRYRHHRAWVRPLHAAVAPLAGVPLPNRPRSWLQVDRDRSRAVLELPAGWHADDRTRQAIATAAAEKLAIEQPDVSWRLGGPTPRLTITAGSSPPAKVTLADLQHAMDAATDDELVLGMGKRGKPVSVSLSGDSPHVGLSMGSGAGKSVLARLIAAQLLNRGGLVVILDPKFISHAWAKGLPNVAYARTPAELHQTLILLARELDRRNEIADEAADVEGHVRASVGPRLLVVAEELNMMQGKLRNYWRDVRESGDPSRSPAATALDDLMFAGRQARINILMIGQRLSAAASGSGDARENLAAKVLGRYSASSWKMLASEHPMPPSGRQPGRVQVVTHSVRECQAGWLTGAEARDYALSGVVATLPRRFGGPVLPATGATEIDGHAGDTLDVTVAPAPVLQGPAEPISLSEAVKSGLIERSLPALRTARHRDPTFPQPVTQRGLAHLYDPDQLARWAAGIE